MPKFSIRKISVELASGKFVLTKGRLSGTAPVDDVANYCVWNCSLFIRDLLDIPIDETIGSFVARKYEQGQTYTITSIPSRL